MASRIFFGNPFLSAPSDLEALWCLEQEVFPLERQESRRGLARSLSSAHQEVWAVKNPESGLVASMTLRFHIKTLRIYSLAVCSACRGQGIGETLMLHAEKRAVTLHKTGIRLEADAENSRLIAWYQDLGYHLLTELPNYYGPGSRALRLQKTLLPEYKRRCEI